MRLDFSLSTMPGGDFVAAWLPRDPLLALVFQAGLAVIGCSLLMLAAVFVLRLRLVLRQRRERRYAAQWQPLLAECVYRVPQTLPRIPAGLRYHFLGLWNYHHESLAGSARGNLEEFASALQLGEIARDMLRRRSLRLRLMAIITLGHLRDRICWSELRELVTDPSPPLSLSAARALLDIDARATLTWLVTVMATRGDWPLARVAAMLQEAGPDRVTLPLIAAARAAAAEGSSPRLVRLLRMMAVAHTGQVGAVAARIVSESTDPEVRAAGLRLLQDPQYLDLVRACAVDASWAVRVNAARALGRFGAPEDRGLLTGMLGDEHWWVRYHAARALLALPFVGLAELEKIRATLADRFAADVLGQVIAEARAG